MQANTKKLDKPNTRQDLCLAVINSLKVGTSPWHQKWDAGSLLIRNGATGKPYTGAYNILLLLAAASSKKLGDPRWATFSQAASNKWKVKTGAKATRIYFWRKFEINANETANASKEESELKVGFTLKSFNVFNLSEIDGAPPLVPLVRPFTPIDAGEKILAASPVPVEHVADIKPHYSLTHDKIYMPLKEHFDKPENYYATLAHEIAHSTGKEDRCDRFSRGFLVGDSVSTDKRAYEELVAEMASLFIAAETGLPYEIEDHAAYIESWVKVLEEKPGALFSASREASLAADFILSRAGLRMNHELTQGDEQLPVELDDSDSVVRAAAVQLGNLTPAQHQADSVENIEDTSMRIG